MTSRQAKIQEDTHFRIVRILQYNPDLARRELADKLDITAGGMSYWLNALIDKGFVMLGNFHKNKFEYIYLLALQGIAEKWVGSVDFWNVRWKSTRCWRWRLRHWKSKWVKKR